MGQVDSFAKGRHKAGCGAGIADGKSHGRHIEVNVAKMGFTDKCQPIAAGGKFHRSQDVAHGKEGVGLIPCLLKQFVRNLTGALVGALKDKALVPQAL